MANNPSYPTSPLQPKPKVIANDPQKTVAAALASSKRQIDQAK
jgi:hypothetical protein